MFRVWRRIPAHFRLHYSELAEKTIVTAEDVNPTSRHVNWIFSPTNVLMLQVPRTRPQDVNLPHNPIVVRLKVQLYQFITMSDIHSWQFQLYELFSLINLADYIQFL